MLVHKLNKPTVILHKLYLPGYMYLSYSFKPAKPIEEPFFTKWEDLDVEKSYYIHTKYEGDKKYQWIGWKLRYDTIYYRWCFMTADIRWLPFINYPYYYFSLYPPDRTKLSSAYQRILDVFLKENV